MAIDVKKWLTAEEGKVYQACLRYEQNYNATYRRSFNLRIRKLNFEKNRRIKDTLEALAESRARSERRRVLMAEAKQYIEDDLSGMPFDDDQVKELEDRGKKIYEKLAQEIEEGSDRELPPPLEEPDGSVSIDELKGVDDET